MAALDTNEGATANPAGHAEAVTPSDTAELTILSRALWVGVTGNVKVTMKDGSVVTFANLPVGWHPLRVKQVWSASTTASSIVAVA